MDSIWVSIVCLCELTVGSFLARIIVAQLTALLFEIGLIQRWLFGWWLGWILAFCVILNAM